MKFKMYKDYFMYIMKHKKNVFKVCWKKGLYIHAITHDLSKFSLSEFKAYAEWFYGPYGTKMYKPLESGTTMKMKHLQCKGRFDKAWIHHFYKNKHHWDHYCYDWAKYNKDKRKYAAINIEDYKLEEPVAMPIKYICQMVCDWDAMSIAFGGTSLEFYMNNYNKIRLDRLSRLILEEELGIPKEFAVSFLTWEEGCERRGTTMEEDLNKILGKQDKK